VVVKEIAGRFFRRSERIEIKWEERHETLLTELRDQLTGARHALEIMGERMTTSRASISETKDRVDNHDCRISALEAGHADLRARFETISEAKYD
jgi:hypothetical protein